MAILIFPKSQGIEEYYQLDRDAVCIGRDSSCDIVLSHGSVSRRHSLVSKIDGRFVIEDLKSKNGTLINGRAIVRENLCEGDQLHFGDILAHFVMNESNSVHARVPISEETFLLKRDDLPVASPKLRYLYELSEMVAKTSDESEAIESGLKIIRNTMNCENSYIGLIDSSGKIERGYYSRFDQEDRAFLLSRTILNKAISNMEACLVLDARRDAALNEHESVVDSGTRSVLCVPIVIAGRLEGVFYADTRSRVRPFEKDDLAFAGALGTLLVSILRNMETVRELHEENRELHQRLDGPDLLGNHPRMETTRRAIRNYASKGDASVLIYGESGTGKELAAGMLHRLSGRSSNPFLAVNCAAFPRELIESELFGHAKGAFTSALNARRGLFELADGGTLFLDEIGEMPADLQSKLLRVLETNEFRPVGSETPVRVDVRIIAATNRKLDNLIAEGKFRSDLYYRLKVLYLELPPLRDHTEDIPLLSDYFLSSLRRTVSTRVTGIAPGALAMFQNHSWPGNVRELKNAIESALYACEEEQIGPEHLEGFDGGTPVLKDETMTLPGALDQNIERLEKAQIAGVLKRHGWNKTKAAEELGIARKTLIAKVKRYHLKPDQE
jgi:transcriptional regulator with GAF, ATPase, and Fis domain